MCDRLSESFRAFRHGHLERAAPPFTFPPRLKNLLAPAACKGKVRPRTMPSVFNKILPKASQVPQPKALPKPRAKAPPPAPEAAEPPIWNQPDRDQSDSSWTFDRGERLDRSRDASLRNMSQRASSKSSGLCLTSPTVSTRQEEFEQHRKGVGLKHPSVEPQYSTAVCEGRPIQVCLASGPRVYVCRLNNLT